MSRHPAKARPPVRFLRAFKAAAEREDWREAAAQAEAIIAAKADCAEAHFALALASIYRDDLATALRAAFRATEIAPGVGDYEDLLAVVYGLGGDLNNALFHGKAAAPRRPHLAALLPESFPSLAQVFLQISEQPLLRRGLEALAKGQWLAAERWLRQHLAFAPESREAAIALGSCLLAQDLPLAAVEALRAARHRLPQDAAVASLLGRSLSQTGVFDLGRACHAAARALAPDDAEVGAAALLDALQDPRCDEAEIAGGYQDWCRAFAVADRGVAPPRVGDDGGGRLTIGYLIASAAGATTAPWLAEILSHRESARFRVVGFGYGALSAPINRVFQKCVDHWQDVAGTDALTFAAMVRGEKIDILVDLAGLDAPDLHAAFASRMAPCQVSWLGIPCLAGPPAVDYILADRFVTKSGGAPSGTTVVTLRLGSTIASPPGVAMRAARQKDESEVLFVADAGLADLNAETVECWSAVLHAVPEAKLVLRDRGFAQADVHRRLMDVFGTFGIAHRIEVMAEPSPRTFFAQGDVCLLSCPYPRPDALTDALSAGIPVVCPAGTTPARRAAGSVLDHLGLADDTVTEDREAYIALAVRWANDSERQAAFPLRLAAAGAETSVWDPAARARDLAAAYERIWTELGVGEEGPGPCAAVA